MIINTKLPNQKNYIFYFTIIIFSIIIVVHLFACFQHIFYLRCSTKIFLIPILLLVYLQITTKESRSIFMIIALILGAAGDILLICKFFRFYLVLGLSSFLLGHYFYVFEIISRIKKKIWKEKRIIVLFLFISFGIFFSYVYKYYLGEGVKKHKFEIPGIAYLSTLGVLDSMALHINKIILVFI